MGCHLTKRGAQGPYHMDEQELIARSREGDLDSFNRLVEIYQGQVHNLAFRMLGSMAAAEDATQESFIAAYTHIKDFRGGSFKAWLLRITTNASYDQLRSGKRQRSVSLESRLEAEPAWEPASGQESTEEHALRGELAQQLSRAFDALPPDQRAALVLSDIEGLSCEEIAQATETSLGTVKSRLSRARAQVRAYLAHHGELLPARYRQDT